MDILLYDTKQVINNTTSTTSATKKRRMIMYNHAKEMRLLWKGFAWNVV